MQVPTIVALVGGVGVTMLAFMLWLAWYVPDEPSHRPPEVVDTGAILPVSE